MFYFAFLLLSWLFPHACQISTSYFDWHVQCAKNNLFSMIYSETYIVAIYFNSINSACSKGITRTKSPKENRKPPNRTVWFCIWYPLVVLLFIELYWMEWFPIKDVLPLLFQLKYGYYTRFIHATSIVPLYWMRMIFNLPITQQYLPVILNGMKTLTILWCWTLLISWNTYQWYRHVFIRYFSSCMILLHLPAQ